jgi:hypothetical protein
MNLPDPTFVPRRTARHLMPAGIGAVALAATLASALYFVSTAEGSQTLDTLPPTAAVDRIAPVQTDAGAATFHAGVDLSAVAAEPDPSPRAIAAYGAP